MTVSVAGGVMLLAVAGSGIWGDRKNNAEIPAARSSPSAKAFSTDIADGVRLRDFEHFGVDLLAFKTCRIEKRTCGRLTLGALNILVLEGVTVNLTSSSDACATSLCLVDGSTTKDHFPTNTFSEDLITQLKQIRKVSGKKVSGLCMKGLSVNRWRDGRIEKLFTATMAESGLEKEKALKLSGCVCFLGGIEGEPVHHARIEWCPALAWVYTQNDGTEKRIFLN